MSIFKSSYHSFTPELLQIHTLLKYDFLFYIFQYYFMNYHINF